MKNATNNKNLTDSIEMYKLLQEIVNLDPVVPADAIKKNGKKLLE